ncbi:MAG TPA: type II secretion system secretin GspD [Stellaceae bacterium]|nr:type II secretion system secretin GspD [Stellaceae bacterium]
MEESLLHGGAPANAPPIERAEPAPPQPPPPTPLTTAPTTEVLPPATVPPAVVQRGTPPAVNQPASATASASVAPGGDVTLNFAGADIREVAHVVLGDILGLNYTVDPAVQGTITVQTSRPLPRAAVLPTLEQIFRSSGAAIIEDKDLIRITPLDGGAKGAPPQGASALALQPTAEFGVQVIPLQFVSAVDLQRVLGPFIPTGATVQVDPTHNLLLVSGAREDVQGLLALVHSFDVDWLTHTSFALVPLRAVQAETVADEMSTIISGETGPGGANTLRIVPIGRLNAVLVITAQPRYLDWARGWIERLDEGGEMDAQRTYVYHVQHGRAAELADVLDQVFGGSGRRRSGSSSAASDAASLPPLSSGSNTGGFGGGGADTGTPSTGAPGSAPIGAGNGAASSNGMLAPLAATPATPAGATPGASSPDSASESGNGASPVRIVTDDANNALVIVTTPRLYRQIEEALRRLDVAPMQVVIDATIAEVTLNDQLQFGLQWFFRQHQSTFASSNSVISPTSVITPAFSGFSYLFSSANMQIVLNALATITTLDVVSAPELLVLNNETAQLQVGASVPIPVQQAQSVLTPGAPLVNTISYLDTGVILRVTPRANANGQVTLDIEQEVSDAAPTTSSTLNAPTVNQRRIKSSVVVQSGQSIALGGLISSNKSLNRSAVPVLGEIPVLGALFRNDDNSTTRTELLVLIQPRVIASSEDAIAATNDLVGRMQYVRPFDPGHH